MRLADDTQGALKTITAERGDTIRDLLAARPSARAETIVDLVEHSDATVHLVRRDPNANAHRIDRVVDEIVEAGLISDSADVPPELAAPLPPELLARARHQEDEQERAVS
jgi:hypothetical protein